MTAEEVCDNMKSR